MNKLTASSGEKIKFKIRFNTAHGGTDLFWRVINDIPDGYFESSVQEMIEQIEANNELII